MCSPFNVWKNILLPLWFFKTAHLGGNLKKLVVNRTNLHNSQRVKPSFKFYKQPNSKVTMDKNFQKLGAVITAPTFLWARPPLDWLLNVWVGSPWCLNRKSWNQKKLQVLHSFPLDGFGKALEPFGSMSGLPPLLAPVTLLTCWSFSFWSFALARTPNCFLEGEFSLTGTSPGSAAVEKSALWSLKLTKAGCSIRPYHPAPIQLLFTPLPDWLVWTRLDPLVSTRPHVLDHYLVVVLRGDGILPMLFDLFWHGNCFSTIPKFWINILVWYWSNCHVKTSQIAYEEKIRVAKFRALNNLGEADFKALW